MKIDILGTKYSVEEKTAEEDKMLNDCDGYCDWTIHTIIVRRELEGQLNNMDEYVKKVKRHEIVHAFMFESGLAHSSSPSDAWAVNEEMIDWIAWNGTKIYKAWEQANAI
jgi:hypothetical protein